MKVLEQTNYVEKSEDFEEIGFTVEITADAFRALTTNIYPDKIKAIIRELSTNAADSHTIAKTKKPFDVHLPNPIEEYFRIRDYGTGISPEKIRFVYTKLFKSDKKDTNELIGCIGIGSKTPFHYGDGFTVTSYYNGKKYLYSAYLNQSGCPTLAKITEVETDEENGLEINIPVNKDFHIWRQRAELVFKYFKRRPNITGQDIKFEECKRELSGNGWYYEKSNSNYSALAIMGNIAYKIPFANKLNGFAIDFNIGDLTFTSSREDLKNDEENKKVVDKRIKVVESEILNVIKAKFKKCRSFYDASIYYNELLMDNVLKNFVKDKIKYRGRLVTGQVTLPIQRLRIEVKNYWNVFGKIKCERNNSEKLKSPNWTFYFNKNNSLVVIDEMRFHEKCRKYCRDNKSDVYAVQFLDDEVDKVKLRAIAKLLGVDVGTFKKTTELEKPVIIRQKFIKEETEDDDFCNVWKLNLDSYIGFYNRKNGWRYGEVDKTKDAYYLQFDRYYAIFNEKRYSNHALKNFLISLQKICGKLDRPLYFITKSTIKKDGFVWKHFSEYLNGVNIPTYLNVGQDDYLDSFISIAQKFKFKNREKQNLLDSLSGYKSNSWDDYKNINPFISFRTDKLILPSFQTFFQDYKCLLLPIDFEALTQQNIDYIQSQIDLVERGNS